MPALPDGDPAPADGSLPPAAAAAVGDRPLSVYLHVPYCARRCGYCDFNTYTAAELPTAQAGPAAYRAAVVQEMALAAAVLGERRRPADTVFIGGGTPTLLGPAVLGDLLRHLRSEIGIAPGAEVSVEANPDSVTSADFEELAAAGVTRVSFGVQSVVRHVLAALDRTHDPDRVGPILAAATAAGLATSVDLIYGAPGESADDWRRSLDAVSDWAPGHVSAYSLVVEDGTRLAAQVRRGEVTVADADTLADRYETADALLSAAGYAWYEVSNFARDDDGRCRHNLGYWRSDDWWGFGPGAHSHVAGVRWWNVKHPAAYAGLLQDGTSPAAARELLSAADRHVEALMLGLRLRDGIAAEATATPDTVAALVDDGLIDAAAAEAGRLVLTLRGRLLADAVVRTLLG